MSPMPKKILEEDEYISGLSKIIKKDFFPDLFMLEAQYDYLKDLEDNNFEMMEEASQRLDALEKKQVYVKQKGNLEEYQNKFISEDNNSFIGLLEKMNEERKRKFLYIKERHDSIFNQSNASIESWSYAAKNALMYNPDGVDAQFNNLTELNHAGIKFNTKISLQTDKLKKMIEMYKEESISSPGIDAPKYSFVPMKPKFTIPAAPKREQIGQALLSRSLQKRISQSTPVGLSPAAKRMWSQMRKEGTGLRNAYTPKKFDSTPKQE